MRYLIFFKNKLAKRTVNKKKNKLMSERVLSSEIWLQSTNPEFLKKISALLTSKCSLMNPNAAV